jgi:hypothetical protein
VLFLFNLIGYKAWFYYLETRSNQEMQASLDKNDYNEQDLVTIKVALSLPYFTNWSEFEEYNGSIEINGQHYNYVKRKVYNDTLILLCIPNHAQNLVSNAQNDYEKLVSDKHIPGGDNKAGKTSTLLKLLTTDYRQGNLFYAFLVLFRNPPAYTPRNVHTINDRFTASPWQPPDTTSKYFI